ncbi:MAG: hypothetical protein AABY22_31975 [Nanoarchaeota archaeon]
MSEEFDKWWDFNNHERFRKTGYEDNYFSAKHGWKSCKEKIIEILNNNVKIYHPCWKKLHFHEILKEIEKL